MHEEIVKKLTELVGNSSLDKCFYNVYTLDIKERKSRLAPVVRKMNVTIQKWGNSQAVRIPKYIVDAVGLHENDAMTMYVDSENRIIIERPKTKKHITLAERLQNYSGTYDGEELDSGEPLGSEVF